MYGSNTFAEGYAIGRDTTNNGNGNGMWNDSAWWIVILLLFGWNGNRGFGGNGGYGNSGGCGYSPCATQADVRAAVDQQTLISKLDNQTYGLADSTYALNNSITSGFHGMENAVCTLGYQNQQGFTNLSAQVADCCCKTQGAIKDVSTQSIFNTKDIQKQISDCCCDVEKMNMQSRFDAQTYNCQTLQAIDRLGDRLEARLTGMETARLKEQLDAERTARAVLQGQLDRAQLRREIVDDVRPCPIPSYEVCNPWNYSNPRSGCCQQGCF